MYKTKNEGQRAYYANLKAQGLCADCRCISMMFARCRKCRQKRNKKDKLKYQSKKWALKNFLPIENSSTVEPRALNPLI